MRVLIIMGGFFPGQKYGGPPVSVDNFCSLMKNHECFIVTHNHDLNDKKPYSEIETGTWISRSNCKVMYVPNRQYSKKTFESVILNLHPEVLYLQGLFQECIIPCLQLAKKHNIKVLIAPRGELCAGAFRKKYKKIPYILYLRISGLLKNVVFQSTSGEETEAIAHYLVKENNKIHYLTNIPSLPPENYQHEMKKKGQAKIVFLSRVHPKKNLLSAIKFLGNINGNITFDIYGPLEDADYWKECKNAISSLPSNVKVKYCGLVSHDTVHNVFSKYDVFLFPTLSENYGHVIAESLFAGTPVIISNQTPWTDLEENGAGWALALDNTIDFIDAIQSVVEWDDIDFEKHTNAAKQYIEKKTYLRQLENEYEAALL